MPHTNPDYVRAFQEGVEAYGSGTPAHANPYTRDTVEWTAWSDGYVIALQRDMDKSRPRNWRRPGN